MNYDQQPMWPENLKFTTVKKGYHPDQVERAMRAHEKSNYILSEQNKALQSEVTRLNNTLGECQNKIQRLVANMNRIEEERARESLRLVGLMTGAGKTADETIAEARRKAEQIIENARQIAEQIQRKAETDARISRDELENFVQIIKETRENLNRYFDSLDSAFRGAGNKVNANQQAASNPAYPLQAQQVPLTSQYQYPAGYPPQQMQQPQPPANPQSGNAGEEDPYTKWIEEQGLRRNGPSSSEKQPPPGRIIARFGDGENE